MNKLLLTPEEAAKTLGVGRNKVYELMGSGALRSLKIGRLRRVPTDALPELVKRLEGAEA